MLIHSKNEKGFVKLFLALLVIIAFITAFTLKNELLIYKDKYLRNTLALTNEQDAILSMQTFEVPCDYPSEEAASPLMVDLDGDLDSELLIVCDDLFVYTQQTPGVYELSFQKPAFDALPAVGELDPGYTGREIVIVESTEANSQESRWTFMAYHADGTALPGVWPREVVLAPSEAIYYPNRVILTDLNQDGSLDILVVEASPDLMGSGRFHGSRVLALGSDGNDLAGFTAFNTPRMDTAYAGLFHSEQFVADVTGDIYPEIISREMFDLSVYDHTGTFIWKLEDRNLGPVAVGDIDGDGANEIISSLSYGTITAYRWDGSTFNSSTIYQLPSPSTNYGIHRIQISDINQQTSGLELLLELHKVYFGSSLDGFMKYVVLSQVGNVLTAFPGTPDINFPLTSDDPAIDEYPVFWNSYQSFVPTNVVLIEAGGEKLMGYEAMTFRQEPGHYMPDTFFEMFKYDGVSVTRFPGFPKKIREHTDYCIWSCPAKYYTPVMTAYPKTGHFEGVAAVDHTTESLGLTIYAILLRRDTMGNIGKDWWQYLHDEQRTSHAIRYSP